MGHACHESGHPWPPRPLCRGLCLHWGGGKRQWRPAGPPSRPWPCSTAAPPLLASLLTGGVRVAGPPSQACENDQDKGAGTQEAKPRPVRLQTYRRQVWLWGGKKGQLGKGPSSLPQLLQKAHISPCTCPHLQRRPRGRREGGKAAWPIWGFCCRVAGPGWGLCKLWCPRHWERPSVEGWMVDSGMDGRI